MPGCDFLLRGPPGRSHPALLGSSLGGNQEIRDEETLNEAGGGDGLKKAPSGGAGLHGYPGER